MNILIVANAEISESLLKLCKNSVLTGNIYTTCDIKGARRIPFRTYEELIEKAKIVQIDLVLIQDESYITKGVVEYLKENRFNVISADPKWLNLETNRIAAKNLAEHYSIKTPMILKLPSTFPVVIKSVEPYTGEIEKFAYSMQELIEKKSEHSMINDKPVYIEEYLAGEEFSMISLWDGKSFLHFPLENITEVQKERLDIYKTKMNFMFSDEKADFTGFVISKLLWSQNEWYLLEYKVLLDENSITLLPQKMDLPYILTLALYQKLGEETVFFN